MVDRLLSVDENFNLPPSVQAALVGSVEANFQTLTAQAQAAAGVANTAAQDAADDAAIALSAQQAAEVAAADAQAPTDEMVSTLVGDEGSQTRSALDTVFGAPSVVVPVQYTGSAWPSRPETNPNSIVLWIGNPGGSAPPAMVLGDVWSQADNTLDGQWQTTSATLTATTNPTLGTGGSSTGRLRVSGKQATFGFRIVFGTTGVNAGSGVYQILLPGISIDNTVLGPTVPLGNVSILDSSTSNRVIAYLTSNSSGNGLLVRISPSVAPGASATLVSNTTPWTWAAGDVLEGQAVFEIV